MNANELADELEKDTNSYNTMCEAATMLRQQQAEIEALKLQLHTTLTNRDLRTYDGKLDMNNKPVAWRKSETDSEGQYFVYREEEPRWLEGYIPLYTHPHSEESVKAKTLTDEEITELYNNFYESQFIEFARAILRKAQEK